MVWRGWDNAEIYDRFVREHRIYRRLNLRVVEFARLQDVKSVLDLACGTGATAMACLRVLDVDAELVGVDASPEMVAVARANVLDPRAHFEVAAAASLHEVAPGPFERVVCNAAFWQFPAPGPALRAVAGVLEPGGLFVFNVPAERLTGESAPVHPFQVALARAVERRTGRVLAGTQTQVDLDDIASLAAERGLERVDTIRLTYEGRQGELMELMEIPAMITPLTGALSESEVAEILEDARRRTDPDEAVEVPWVFAVFRRQQR